MSVILHSKNCLLLGIVHCGCSWFTKYPEWWKLSRLLTAGIQSLLGHPLVWRNEKNIHLLTTVAGKGVGFALWARTCRMAPPRCHGGKGTVPAWVATSQPQLYTLGGEPGFGESLAACYSKITPKIFKHFYLFHAREYQILRNTPANCKPALRNAIMINP